MYGGDKLELNLPRMQLHIRTARPAPFPFRFVNGQDMFPEPARHRILVSDDGNCGDDDDDDTLLDSHPLSNF